MTIAVTLRPMLPDDARFIASTWVKSYASSDLARLCTRGGEWPRASRAYREGQNRLVDRLLARAACTVAEDSEGLVAAYLVHEGDVVHYVYVRDMYRREGLAKQLLGARIERACVFTHLARGVKPPALWRFDPFAAFLEAA